MQKDEWTLTEELKRLNKYGIVLTAKRTNENQIGTYNIIVAKTGEIIEPCCGIEEILGIINVLDNYMSRTIYYYESRLKYEKSKE